LNQKDVFFIDVQFGKETTDGTSRYNIEEIEATVSVLKDLIAHTQDPKNVSVAAIFPYAAQISRFQKNNKDLINQAKQAFESFEIDTVDAFQGKEADIVLVNTVVTDPSKRNFLNDFRRINVSMSRARDKLFIFGNPGTLSKIDMQISGGSKRKYFAEIIEDIKRFESELFDYLTTSKDNLLTSIRESGNLSDKDTAELESAIIHVKDKFLGKE
jgi:superfamily I DNA and/or RNA helicase